MAVHVSRETLVVVSLVFQAPSCLALGPGRCVCRWAVARPRAVRAASCCWLRAGVLGAGGPGRPRDRHTRACGSEWSISKPARALRSLRRPPYPWRLGVDVRLDASTRCPARPRRRPPAPRPDPPVLPAPSTPAAPGALASGRPCPAATHRHRDRAPCGGPAHFLRALRYLQQWWDDNSS